MAEMRATPQSPSLGKVARGLRSLQELANRYQIDPRVPLLGGTSVDELLGLPGAAREVENWSYGNAPMRVNPYAGRTASYVPEVKPGRKSDLADTLLLGADAASLGAPIARGAGRAALRELDRAMLEGTGPLAGVVPEAVRPMNVVKPKGGNWLAGSVERALGPLKKSVDPELAGYAERGQNLMPHEAADVLPKMALNKWIDTKLTKYVKNEMATPEDPVRALAERGTLHFEPQGGAVRSHTMRAVAGMPTEPTATTPLARAWEDVSDAAVMRGQYQDMIPFAESGEEGLRKYGGEYAVKNPQAVAYAFDTGALPSDMGFPHIIDELTNAMNPNSGLPASLRLTPQQLEKITVPQAVERVAKINEWRAEEAIKAERAGMLENLQATPRMADDSFQLSFVVKPGGAWVDIPETVTDKGMKLCSSIGKAGGWCTQAEWAAKSYGSGENRLTALVDTEGRPHAQAKITSIVDDTGAFDAVIDDLTPAQEAAWDAHFGASNGPPELREALGWLQEHAPNVYKKYQDVLASQPKEPPDITELKPVGNSFKSERAQEYGKRDPEYFRKVENAVLKFLNSGKWGKVKDLDLYGIVRIHPDSDLGMNLRAANVTAPEFVTQRQLGDLLDKYGRTNLPPSSPEGYATGGAVRMKDGGKPPKRRASDLPGYGEGSAGALTDIVRGLTGSGPSEPTNPSELFRIAQALGAFPPVAGAVGTMKRAKALKSAVGAGESPAEIVYHAGAEFKQPRPGLFTNPEREAVEQYQRSTGAPRIHTFEARPRRTGTDDDVYAMAKRLGIYEPNVPAGQYLEQGQNAVFPESAQLVQELRNVGFDSLRLKDGMGKQPSLVALDPGVLSRPQSLFAPLETARGPKSLGEMIDREVRKVRRMEELGKADLNVKINRPAGSEVTGWHITQDTPGILKTGALTNRDVGAGNMQGYPPAHVGGAYFYSDPQLALAKREDLLDMVEDYPELANMLPILRAQLRRGNRLLPDEDVGLDVPWQRSFEEGSFATGRPVLLNQIDRIYASDPDAMKDLIRDTAVRQRRYNTGGSVSSSKTPRSLGGLLQRYNVDPRRYAEGGTVDTRLLEDVARLGAEDPSMELAGYFKNANQATRNEAMKRGFYNTDTGPDFSLIDQAKAMKAANPAADTSGLFANANLATKNQGSMDRFYQFSNQEINDSNARALANTEFVDQDGRTVTPPSGDEQDWLSKSVTVGSGGPGGKIVRAVYVDGVKPDPTNPKMGISTVAFNPFVAQEAAKYIQDTQERQRQGRVDGGMYRYSGLDVSDLTTPYDPRRERDPGIPFLGRYTIKNPSALEPFKPLSLPSLSLTSKPGYAAGGLHGFDNNSIQQLALLAQSQGRNLASPEEAGMFAMELQQANTNPNSMSRYTEGGRQLQFTGFYRTDGEPIFSLDGSLPANTPAVSQRPGPSTPPIVVPTGLYSLPANTPAVSQRAVPATRQTLPAGLSYRPMNLHPETYAAGGAVNYNPSEIDTIVSEFREAFHG